MGAEDISFIEIYSFVCLGIVISVILPIVRKMIPRTEGGPAGLEGRFWTIAKPYIALGILSLMVGLLIVAFSGESLKDWRAALLVGYAWDSTLQKIR